MDCQRHHQAILARRPLLRQEDRAKGVHCPTSVTRPRACSVQFDAAALHLSPVGPRWGEVGMHGPYACIPGEGASASPWRVRLPLTRIAQMSAAASRTIRAFTPVFAGLWLDDAAEKLRSDLSPPGPLRGEVKRGWAAGEDEDEARRFSSSPDGAGGSSSSPAERSGAGEGTARRAVEGAYLHQLRGVLPERASGVSRAGALLTGGAIWANPDAMAVVRPSSRGGSHA
jgi:hypothetical protein